MNKLNVASVSVLCCLLAFKAYAFDIGNTLTIDAFPDHIERQQVEERLVPHSDSLLGDLVDLNTGTVEFVHTDVEIPGNSSLEVALRRTRTGGFKFPHKDAASRKAFSASSIPLKNTSHAFGDWELDVPNVSQLVPFGLDDQLQVEGINTSSIDFCSVQYFTRAIHIAYGTPEVRGFVEHEELSNGVMLTAQSGHKRRLLDIPKGLDWPSGAVKTTTDYWYARCISNSTGINGLEIISPNGDRYIFDQVQFRHAVAVPTIALDGVTNTPIYTAIPRIEVRLQVSEVRDKHGNWVRYSYDSAGWVKRIFSNDGREIKVNYDGGLVQSVEANGRTWYYRYGTTQTNDSYLTSVELPDARKWQFDLAEARPLEALREQDCEAPDQQWRLVHPDGIIGTFLFSETRHAKGLSGDSKSPFCDGRNPVYVGFYDVMSIKRKTLVGPNYPSSTWSFNYSGFPVGASRATKWGEVVNPTGERIRTTFHNADDINLEGLTKSIETFSSAGNLEERVDYEYVVENEVGHSLMDGSPAKLHRPRHQSRVIVSRGSDTYSTDMIYNTAQTSSQYSYGRPTQIERASNVSSGSRRTNFTYHNMTGLWLLGLPLTETLNDQLQNSYVYDPKGRMTSHARYGSVLTRVGYNDDGTVDWVEDKDGHRWHAFDWKRGVAQTVERPDGEKLSQLVDDNGWVTRITDFESVTKNYGYDALGRLELVDNPSSWNDISFRFVPATSAERTSLGLGSGTYKRTMTRGNFLRTRYFDGFLRPVLESKKDTSSGTTYYLNREFDAYGNVTFESYWSTSPTESQGVRKAYDGLRRLVSTVRTADSAETKIEYLSGNRVKTTDPRGHANIVSYKAYGQPDRSMPVSIAAPEGVTTTLSYNLFGNLESVSQGGFTEQRYYDSHQNLCRVVRPEIGDTVFSHTPAGELTWEARGLSLSGTGCQLTAVPEAQKIHYKYDDLGRLRQTLYPDNTPDLTFNYTKNGQLEFLDTGNGANWTYGYNTLGLLDAEMLEVDSQTFTVGYGYNANGVLKDVQYPSNRLVSYSPDAFGRPSQAGSYASNASYHPNGMLWKFTYGNGLAHTTELNSIKLPWQRKDVNGGNTIYSQSAHYDKSLNITSLVDGTDNHYDLGMTYDGLDRLDKVSGSWGAGDIDYDLLGNIERMTLGTFLLDYAYDGNNRLDTVTGSKSYSFGYDNRGNVTANGSRAFTYNLANQMTASGNNSYQYDGHGKRVKSTTTTGTVYSYYNRNGRLLYKYDTNGTASDFIYLGERLVAKDTAGPGAFAPSSSPVLAVPSKAGLNEVITATWTAVTDATFYLLQRQRTSDHWESVYNQDETSADVVNAEYGNNNYRVAACNAAGCGQFSSLAVSIAPPGTPSSITVPSSTDTDGSFTISWSSTSTATSYVLQEQKNSGSWTQVASQSVTNKALSGRGNGSYKYRVQACNSSGCSGWKTSGNFGVLHPPGVPGSISVPTSTDTNGAYTVSWPGVSTATSYTLREQKNGGSYTTVATQSGTSKVLSGRGNGTYKYAARACNASGCSGYRYSATFDVLLPPSAPSLSAPSSDGDGAYAVSWGSSSTATSYNLQQKIGSGSWANAYSGSSRSKSYSGKSEGNYYYRVRACNASGCGSWSGTKTVVVDYPAITYFDVTPSVLTNPSVVTVTWKSSNASYCQLRKNGVLVDGNRETNGQWFISFSSNGIVEVKCINGPRSHSRTQGVTVKNPGGDWEFL